MLPPLAERMRPRTLEDFTGQEHLTGREGALRKIIESGNIPSMILWGPPGVGKTTLVHLIARHHQRTFYQLSAISAGVKEVREVIQKARDNSLFRKGTPILFIDEIHRFNKAQQDSLLAAVEQGVITLIGATTENPSFEVVGPLLSRCQVYVLNPLSEEALLQILSRAITGDEELKKYDIVLQETEALLRTSGGDARKSLNALELAIASAIPALKKDEKKIVITNHTVLQAIQSNIALYDKNGELHYDIISAFIKSVRGSDPNAALYWLARMIEGGEDVKFIARRLIILAAEDIGLANPNALMLATSCFHAVDMIGLPEARIILAETTIYLATSPKSNSAYMAIDSAIDYLKEKGPLPVPLHLRNAPTRLMKDLHYGENYQYAHAGEDHFVLQEYLPEEISGKKFYEPADNPREKEIRERLSRWWKKYHY